MQKSAPPLPASDPLVAAVVAIAALTLYRIAMLPLAQADLFVDEAQYWLWGQELAFGYYSKPPLVGWVIRAATELGGSDSAFWIRLPGPLLHAATALLLIGAARQIMPPAPAAMTGLVYATIPAVALASIFISTDTVLLPFFAAALWLWIVLRDTGSLWAAIGLGVCVGLGMMAKYAGFYFVLCAALVMLFVPPARIAPRGIAVALLAMLAVIAPNIVWNLQNDLVTLSHTADNADWVRSPGLTLNPGEALEFLAGQALVIGPLFFLAYLVAAPASAVSRDWTRRWLFWMSVPILLLVVGQALLSKAFANWAVTAYAAGLIMLTVFLWERARPVFWIGLALNAGLALFLPVASMQVDNWTRANGELLMKRYTGRAELSRQIMEAARAEGVRDIVSDRRPVLSDLFYTGRDSGLSFFAVPGVEPVPHYYAQKHPYPGDRPGSFLYVTFDRVAPPCGDGAPDLTWIAGPGEFRGTQVNAYVLPSNCWQAEAAS